MNKFKYVAIFLLPITVAISFTLKDWMTFLPTLVFFVILPLAELLLPPNDGNLNEDERNAAERDPFYMGLLYLLVPLQIGYLAWYLLLVIQEGTQLEIIGRTIAMGMMCGIIGINIGHELGHRSNAFERLMGEILMLTSLENHFIPYHNRGHHANVATSSDPATARKNEPLYFFWFRSQIGSYIQAWQIEIERMRIAKKALFGLSNLMVVYTILHISLCLIIYTFLGWNALYHFLWVALIGIILLETVNYIEHYGLLRKKKENGGYDRVRRIHSWNSNHVFGRVVLFELTRHSDHHYKPDRPYQLLESHDDSPTMPTGYPGMMILALVPPLFFWVMNQRIVKDL
jgi:alkane 1-monooxygenase